MAPSARAGYKDTLFKTNHTTSFNRGAERENEIQKLDIQYMVSSLDSEFTFSIVGTTKTSRVKRYQT